MRALITFGAHDLYMMLQPQPPPPPPPPYPPPPPPGKEAREKRRLEDREIGLNLPAATRAANPAPKSRTRCILCILKCES
ncbi:hypothetical protein PRIPAC_94180 [Pristionchus pacificus]|uniref:Uncharacterized protein n=1 Tax=Pristionchus pacificus TaxID=54126 RepID=A0A2A6C9H2_PRIPA|nr:hypothetical protein PRIPAC_94180 [Pristionchus pacificus]|eukprot:PDM74703.1 hypothetical protein PRIPAC_43654 [Pristionchus pacificus]